MDLKTKVNPEGKPPRKNNESQKTENNHTERRKGMKSTEKLPYEEAKLEVILFDTNDIITSSRYEYEGGTIEEDEDDILLGDVV